MIKDKQLRSLRRNALLGICASGAVAVSMTIAGICHYRTVHDALENGRWSPGQLQKVHDSVVQNTSGERAKEIAALFVKAIETDRDYLRLDLEIFNGLTIALVAMCLLLLSMSWRLRKVLKTLEEDRKTENIEPKPAGDILRAAPEK